MRNELNHRKNERERRWQVQQNRQNRMEKKFSMREETSKTKTGEYNKVPLQQGSMENQPTKKLNHSLLRETIAEICMSTENDKIECPAKPVTFVFKYFNDNERNFFVRSANMTRKELRGRKIKISHSHVCGSLTMCSCLQQHRSSFKTWCEFKHSTEKVGLKVHPGESYQPELEQRKSNGEIDNIKVEILAKEGSTKCLGHMVTFSATGDNRDQESKQGCLERLFFKPIQTRVDLKILPSSAPASLIRHGDLNDELTHHETWTPSKEHERMIQSTLCSMLRLIIQTKRKYKKDNKNEEKVEEGGRKPEKRKMEKKRKKITEALKMNLEELKHRLRSRQRHLLHERCRWRNWQQTFTKKKNGLKTWRETHMKPWTDETAKQSNAGSKHTEEWHGDQRWEWGNESSRMEPWTQHEVQNTQSCGKTKEKMENEINDFLKPETTEDETSNVERYDNEWIKTAKDQECWKKIENKFATEAAAAPGTGHQRRTRTFECAWHLTRTRLSRDRRQAVNVVGEKFGEIDGAHHHAGLRALFDVDETPKHWSGTSSEISRWFGNAWHPGQSTKLLSKDEGSGER